MKTFNLICYLVVAAIGLLFAFLYLFRPEFMPYHADAVGTDWNGVEARYQVLIIALMRVSGGGWLATTASLLFLTLVPFRKDKYWSNVAILIVGLAGMLPTLYATLYVRSHSPANPPWLLTCILIAVLLLGFIISTVRHVRSGRD